MTMFELRTTVRKYRTAVAASALILFTVIALVGIWYIRSVNGPLAPNAPSSRPKAAAAVCSLQFEIPMECTSLTASTTVAKGNSVTFTCQALAGADSYLFTYRSSSSDQYAQLAQSGSNVSPALTIGDYVDVRCQPCAGEYCATDANVSSKCQISYVAPSPSPSPSPTPTPSPTPSPTPTPSTSCNSSCSTNSDCPSSMICSNGSCRNEQCTESTSCTCGPVKAAFVIEKYNDKNGNATRDSGEPGLSWDFEWEKNNDGNFRAYQTYSSQDGRGGTVGGLDDNDSIHIREKSKSGWSSTTPTEVTLTVKVGETSKAQFGNWKPSTPAPSPTPTTPGEVPSPTPVEKLPTAGSTGQTVALLTIGLTILGLGAGRWYILHKRV